MTDERWAAVDQYINDHLVGDDPALDATLDASSAAGLPPIAVSPSQGKLLHILAKALGARKILELGTLGGYSGIWLARALPQGGRLTTIEYDPTHAAIARQSFDRAGVGDRIDLRVGKALDVLPMLEAEGAGPFDLVFIDADKETYTEYLDWSIRLSRPGTLIIADNIVRDGEVVNAASTDHLVQGIRRFLDALAKDPRVTATGIQTVGQKSYDGFAAILVNAPVQ